MRIDINKTNGSIAYSLDVDNNSISQTIKNAIIEKVELSSITIDNEIIVGVNFKGADLANCIFIGCKLCDCNFDNCNLHSTRFTDCAIVSSSFDSTILCNVTFKKTTLDNVSFYSANLTKADFLCSTIINSTFSSANLSYARFIDTSMDNCVYFRDTILNCVKGLKYATVSFDAHGKKGRQLTAVVIDGKIKYFCGCFNGNAKQLKDYILLNGADYAPTRRAAMNAVTRLIKLQRT